MNVYEITVSHGNSLNYLLLHMEPEGNVTPPKLH